MSSALTSLTFARPSLQIFAVRVVVVNAHDIAQWDGLEHADVLCDGVSIHDEDGIYNIVTERIVVVVADGVCDGLAVGLVDALGHVLGHDVALAVGVHQRLADSHSLAEYDFVGHRVSHGLIIKLAHSIV